MCMSQHLTMVISTLCVSTTRWPAREKKRERFLRHWFVILIFLGTSLVYKQGKYFNHRIFVKFSFDSSFFFCYIYCISKFFTFRSVLEGTLQIWFRKWLTYQCHMIRHTNISVIWFVILIFLGTSLVYKQGKYFNHRIFVKFSFDSSFFFCYIYCISKFFTFRSVLEGTLQIRFREWMTYQCLKNHFLDSARRVKNTWHLQKQGRSRANAFGSEF